MSKASSLLAGLDVEKGIRASFRMLTRKEYRVIHSLSPEEHEVEMAAVLLHPGEDDE